jgi:hypothetical protein
VALIDRFSYGSVITALLVTVLAVALFTSMARAANPLDRGPVGNSGEWGGGLESVRQSENGTSLGDVVDPFSIVASDLAFTHTLFFPILFKGPERILFIGDSFSRGLNTYLPPLAATGNPMLTVQSDVIWSGGEPLKDHFLEDSTLDTIRNGRYDYVVLQDDLADHWSTQNVQDFTTYASQFNDIIKQTGAKTVLYMTWQYEDDDSPTIQQIAAVYTNTAVALSVPVAPVGLAFSLSQQRSGPDLYSQDGVHTSDNGYYLMMCVLYNTLFNRTPVGLGVPGGLTVTAANFLQQVAADTVATYKTTAAK